jgi:uncharacterized protein
MKRYNFKIIRRQVYSEVKRACFSPKNKFKNTVWEFHILPVINHSLKLGKKFKADLEVLELAALLHDYAGIIDYRKYENHHCEGANLAGLILSKTDFPPEKIRLVQECIYRHRGSAPKKKKFLEAQILASADAMSHISELADMFFLAYGIHKYQTKEGSLWLANKLKRSYKKIMPEGKKMINEDYKIALKILNFKNNS